MSPAVADPPSRVERVRPPARTDADPLSVEQNVRPTVTSDNDLALTGRVAERVVLHTERGSVEIPGMSLDYDAVRAWALSDDSPEDFRFSFLDGYAEIGRVIELRTSHATPKVEIVYALRKWAKVGRRGLVFTDAMLYSEPNVGLSCEPDAILVLPKTEAAGRISWTPEVNREGDPVELLGAADLVCEVVSDGSTTKDLRLEPPLLFAAGVREFWRADCREERCEFTIFNRGADGWDAVPTDADGYALSAVTGVAFRLDRLPPAANGWIDYDLKRRD